MQQYDTGLYMRFFAKGAVLFTIQYNLIPDMGIGVVLLKCKFCSRVAVCHRLTVDVRFYAPVG